MQLKDIGFTKDNSRAVPEDGESLGRLSESIDKTGLITPMILYKDSENPDTFKVIAGQRRYLALKKLRGESGYLTESEYIIWNDNLKKSIEEIDILEISIIENQFRESLSPMDLNRAALKLNQKGSYKDKEIARILDITPTRLKRILNLSIDQNKMLPEIREELKKSGGEGTFTDAHWDKMRDIEDMDTLKDVFEQIMDKQLPPKDIPGIINAVNKAKDAYDDEQGKGSPSSVASPDEGDNDEVGIIKYKHKGKLEMFVEGGKTLFRVVGRGEDDKLPLDHYMEYLGRPDKFQCKIDLKITFVPIGD